MTKANRAAALCIAGAMLVMLFGIANELGVPLFLEIVSVILWVLGCIFVGAGSDD